MNEQQSSRTTVPADAEHPGRRSYRRFAGSVPVLLLGVSAAALSTRLGLGSLRQPEPGLWPFLVSVALSVFAVASLVDDRTGDDPDRLPLRRVLLGVASLGLFIVGFEHLGPVVPTLVVLLLWLRVLARETWSSTVVIAVAATAALWVVFDLLLGVPLPAGVLAG